jgi:presenilin-like A22 family membrane protease
MKHPFSPTAILVVLFLCSQIIGLGLITLDTQTAILEDGTISVENSEPITGPRPATSAAGAFLYLVVGIGLGTGILLIMAKYKTRLLWKIWYMFAIAVTTATALGVFLNPWVAYGLGIIFAVLKAQRPQSLVHNITEILVHSGIAIILVPILNVFWACMMLLAIAAYDAYAVWKSKHMVKLATFMTDSQLFAGLHVPYAKNTKKSVVSHKKVVKKKSKSAILGGGDIAFPLLFSGAVLQWLLGQGITKTSAFGLTSIITVCATLGLIGLFIGAKKDHFYPAMPFLSGACLIGFGIVALII